MVVGNSMHQKSSSITTIDNRSDGGDTSQILSPMATDNIEWSTTVRITSPNDFDGEPVWPFDVMWNGIRACGTARGIGTFEIYHQDGCIGFRGVSGTAFPSGGISVSYKNNPKAYRPPWMRGKGHDDEPMTPLERIAKARYLERQRLHALNQKGGRKWNRVAQKSISSR